MNSRRGRAGLPVSPSSLFLVLVRTRWDRFCTSASFPSQKPQGLLTTSTLINTTTTTTATTFCRSASREEDSHPRSLRPALLPPPLRYLLTSVFHGVGKWVEEEGERGGAGVCLINATVVCVNVLLFGPLNC